MDSSTVSTMLAELTVAASSVTGLLSSFVPIIAGVAVAGLAVGLIPRLIKRVGGSL